MADDTPRDPDLANYQTDASAPLSTNTPFKKPDADDASREEQRKALCPLELSDDDMHELWSAIERARARRKHNAETWKILLKEYIPVPKASGDPEVLKVNVHFRNTHTKIGQLFNRTPRVTCIPKGPLKDQVKDPLTGVVQTGDKIGVIKEEVLNYQLGPDAINASRLMDECGFDILAWAGLAAVKIGYRATIKMVDKPVMVPAPVPPTPTAMPGPMGQPATPTAMPPGAPPAPGPSALPPQPKLMPLIGPDGRPVMKPEPVPIYEDWYARRFTPMKVLWNDDLASSRFDEEATWMGWDFAIPKKIAQQEFALSDDELVATGDDDFLYKHDDKQGAGRKDLVKGVELWRKAAIFRPTEQPHPLALDHIVVIDGIKDYPVVCRPSPDQSFDDEGRLTDDSLIGFPIEIVQIRDLADSPFTPADAAFTNAQAKELNTHRRQSVLLRDRAIGKQFADSSHIDDTDKDKLTNGEVGDIIYVKPGALAAAGGAKGILDNTTQPESTADDWRTEEIIKRDMEETLGIGGPQAGTPTETVRSATELAQMATAFGGRMEKEQSRFIGCFVKIARKVDTLLMRYATETQYIPVVGEDGTRELVAWNNKVISGRYSYDIVPDSSWRMDSAQHLRMSLSLYNLAKGDPLFNRGPVLRQIAQQLGHKDAVLTPEQLQAMAAQGEAQPPHAQAKPDTHEEARTGNRQNAPQAGNKPSRVM